MLDEKLEGMVSVFHIGFDFPLVRLLFKDMAHFPMMSFVKNADNFHFGV